MKHIFTVGTAWRKVIMPAEMGTAGSYWHRFIVPVRSIFPGLFAKITLSL